MDSKQRNRLIKIIKTVCRFEYYENDINYDKIVSAIRDGFTVRIELRAKIYIPSEAYGNTDMISCNSGTCSFINPKLAAQHRDELIVIIKSNGNLLTALKTGDMKAIAMICGITQDKSSELCPALMFLGEYLQLWGTAITIANISKEILSSD